MKKDELVDYIIDGIPDKFLQNQTRMQRFERKYILLRAFEKIKLWPEKGKRGRDSNVNASDKSKQEKSGVARKDETKAEGARCFNCNQMSHWAKECIKPKRDRGSCYECREKGHVLRDCLRRQKKSAVPETDAEPKKETAQVAKRY